MRDADRDRLAALYGALYRALGEGAPRLARDVAVVRLHESARAFGALALALERPEVEPDPFVTATLVGALEDDASGDLALFALAMVVGPRLLVSLRDLREVEPDPLLDEGSRVVLAEVRAAGLAASGEDRGEEWDERARRLRDTFDQAGYAESLAARA